jgi:hypothetical protein
VPDNGEEIDQLAGGEHQQVPHARDLQLQVEVHRGPEAVRQDEERLEMKKVSKNPLKSMRDKIRNLTKTKGMPPKMKGNPFAKKGGNMSSKFGGKKGY